MSLKRNAIKQTATEMYLALSYRDKLSFRRSMKRNMKSPQKNKHPQAYLQRPNDMLPNALSIHYPVAVYLFYILS